jgi:hypothetical protein
MRSPVNIRHEFVEFIPKERQEGVLYVSIPYATAVHNCFCGCGLKRDYGLPNHRLQGSAKEEKIATCIEGIFALISNGRVADCQ